MGDIGFAMAIGDEPHICGPDKETRVTKMDTVLATLADRGLRPKVIHNREARVSAAFALREITSLGGSEPVFDTLEISVGIFACSPHDVWIRSRGYQGAVKRLERRPEKFTVSNIREGEREEIIDEIFAYFSNLPKTRQAADLFSGLVNSIGNGRIVSYNGR